MNHMISLLKNKGYNIDDPWDAVDILEEKIANYCGSKYAVCLDSCSNAIFLCLKYFNITNQIITLPKNTYASVPMQCIHAGNFVRFENVVWSGQYEVGNTGIIDSATRFTKNMYAENYVYCLSFHYKKILQIGKGGAILTNNSNFVNWLRPMIYDGRNKRSMYANNDFSCIGYHMYMTPEDAAIGILKFDQINEYNADTGNNTTYKDLSQQKIFKDYIR